MGGVASEVRLVRTEVVRLRDWCDIGDLSDMCVKACSDDFFFGHQKLHQS